MGCVVALALGVPLAHADGGRITFVGSIVTPTCGFGGDASFADLGGGCGPAASSVPHASLYRQDVVALETINDGDKLLSYFSGYADASTAQLVTRNYE